MGLDEIAFAGAMIASYDVESPAAAMTHAQLGRSLGRHGCARVPLPRAQDLLNLAHALGRPLSARPDGEVVHRLAPVTEADAHPRSLSALHGTGAFPMHTDCAHHRVPPRYVVLRCVSPGGGSRATLIADTHALPLTHAGWSALRRAVFVVRGGAGGTFLASMLAGERLRYDAGCMRVAHPSFASAPAMLTEALTRSQIVRITWNAGDGVVIDNWRCLHGRDDTGNDDADRLLERVAII